MGSQILNIKSRFSKLLASKKITRGFTLIELMVTVGIFVFMTALVLAKYNNFYSGTVFTNLVFDVALTIKQAQTYGLSVKVNESDTTDANFNAAYGVHFPHDNHSSFSLASYDYNNSGNSNKIDSFKEEKTYTMKHGAKITGIEVKNNYTRTGTPIESGFNLNEDDLDIIFKRPNPEAIICIKSSGDLYSRCQENRYVSILIETKDETTAHTIQVDGQGKITIVPYE